MSRTVQGSPQEIKWPEHEAYHHLVPKVI